MAAPRPTSEPAPWVPWAVLGVVVATVVQLALGASSDLPQFAGKGFGARLAAYPVLMLLVPLVAVVRRARRNHRHQPSGPLPWWATLLVALPFLVDVTGNTLDLYDAVGWWDDANHLVNWALLSVGAGLLLRDGGVRPHWALALCTAGVGALLAVAWELGEWAAFIRFGEVDGGLAAAYGDTLGDLALGCLGAAAAGAVVARRALVAERSAARRLAEVARGS
ncbi:hypothetical protein [Quadrisphaera sp. KR29]|uniref:hypothetical protein n=1 Tax=Quadrisphaera sp. KR29 TaxID=3461391 RepID=UPI004044BF4D